MQKIKPPIFICGHRKCGTTMLHKLFDNHNKLITYPTDLNLMYAYFPTYISNNYSNSERKKRLENILFQDLKSQLSLNNLQNELNIKLFKKLFFENLDDADLIKIENIIRKLILAFLKITNSFDKTLVIKETSLEIYMHKIVKWFPDSKFIHLIRDPRDNYGALKSGVENYYSKFGEDEKLTLSSLIYRTRLGLNFGIMNKEKFGDKKYKFLNFNELVETPEIKMKEICNFLNINFSTSLLQPTLFGRNIEANNFKGKKFVGISNKNNNRWIERITEDETKIIEFHLGKQMLHFGYSLSFTEADCLIAVSNFYEWENYKFYYNDRF